MEDPLHRFVGRRVSRQEAISRAYGQVLQIHFVYKALRTNFFAPNPVESILHYSAQHGARQKTDKLIMKQSIEKQSSVPEKPAMRGEGQNGANEKVPSIIACAKADNMQLQPWIVVVRDEVSPCYPEFEMLAADRQEAEAKGLKACLQENGDDPDSGDNGFSPAIAYNREDLLGMLTTLDEMTNPNHLAKA